MGKTSQICNELQKYLLTACSKSKYLKCSLKFFKSKEVHNDNSIALTVNAGFFFVLGFFLHCLFHFTNKSLDTRLFFSGTCYGAVLLNTVMLACFSE